MSVNVVIDLLKSILSELSNVKATPASILVGTLSLIGLLTVLKYQLSFLNLLFCFSPLSEPFKISLSDLKVNLFKKRNSIEPGKDEKNQASNSTNIPQNSSSWAIITGPTNGIGREFAIELSKAGFNLFLIGRNLEKLNSLKADLNQKYNSKIEIEIETIDLSLNFSSDDHTEKSVDLNHTSEVPIEQQTKGKDWKKILDKLNLISTHSNISILINNAGLSHSQPTEFHQNDIHRDIDSILNVNVLSVLYLTKLVIPFMLKFKKGLILNVGSFSALIPTPLLSTYAGSKSFLYTWSQALGTELEPKGIDVRLLNTYFVASEMSKIRKSSFLIPSPNGYVKKVLNNLISTNLKPYVITGYFSHSLLEFFLDHFGPLVFWLKFNLKMQLSILERINKKKNRKQISKE